jgi:NADH dehydrogenase
MPTRHDKQASEPPDRRGEMPKDDQLGAQTPAIGLAGRSASLAATGGHDIIVVGGGASGIELATQLGDSVGKRGQARVTLIEKTRTHLWKPMIHAIAAGSMNAAEHELNYLAQAHWHNFRYRVGEMTGLDRANHLVHMAASHDEEGREVTPARSFHYDTLVISVGSVTNDFGTPGVAHHAVPLETLEQAIRFNKRVVNACIRAHAQPGDVRPGQLHVTIIGAGATGTELAADLHRTVREVLAYGLDRVNPERDVRVVLIEATDRILPALPPRISEKVHSLLVGLGVEVRTGARVTEVRGDGVMLASGEFLPSELVVWAAGVKAPDFLRDLDGLEVNRINQLVVGPTLQTTRDPNIFAMGDCAQCPRPGHAAPVPPRAQAAHQQASHMLKQIQRRLEGGQMEPYVYRDFGSLVTLGQYETVGVLSGLLGGKSMFIEGYLAKQMYRSLYKMHEMALHGSLKTLIGSIGRSIARRAEPQVKLH